MSDAPLRWVDLFGIDPDYLEDATPDACTCPTDAEIRAAIQRHIDTAVANVVRAVDAIHVSSQVTRGVGRYHPDALDNWMPYCDSCGDDWPCETSAALNPFRQEPTP